ncbi:transposase [Streptomyces sp. NBC_01278]|uniref:transposase n=1 Tax=Streptomyces sp. NBC_01278 TaxID=2903809 RepID=UPI002E33F83E|nr:transposase [Streptomyces sp. NBC_01278]
MAVWGHGRCRATAPARSPYASTCWPPDGSEGDPWFFGARTWLIAQWLEGEDEPTKYWISNLPAHIPAKDLVRLAKSRWRIEHDHRELKTALGLDHFEGRSFTGWHRHVTLATAAHLFLTEQRRNPKVPARA